MNTFKEIRSEEFNYNPFKIIGTDWMLITTEKDGKCNTMTASWGGLGVMWNKNVAYIVIRPQRFTKEFVDHSDTFSLTFFNESYKKALGYLGAKSGRDEDKIKNANLTIQFDEKTPYFEEANMVIFCKKLFAQAYQPESFMDSKLNDEIYPTSDHHTLYIGEITKILVSE